MTICPNMKERCLLCNNDQTVKYCKVCNSKKLFTKIIVLSSLTALLLFVIQCRLYREEMKYMPRQTNITDKYENLRKLAHNKLILQWTPFYGDTLIDSKIHFKNCDVMCDITNNKNDIVKAHAVYFLQRELWTEAWTINRASIEFPQYRGSDQIWVLHNAETPANLFGNFEQWNGIFNWTMWYRTDSTIWAPYGRHYNISTSDVKLKNSKFNSSKNFEEKTKFAYGLMGNCVDAGRRYIIIDKLRQFLSNIDIFGECYGKYLEFNLTATDSVFKSYKFYLAFENSYCVDYVTEKYWGAIRRSQIPIVNWKYVHKSIGIPGSFINIHDFPSLKSLAEYMAIVSKNETLYNSYFAWKQKYSYVAYHDRPADFCSLCRHLHAGDISRQSYDDLHGWITDDICPKATVYHSLKRRFQRLLYNWFGI